MSNLRPKLPLNDALFNFISLKEKSKKLPDNLLFKEDMLPLKPALYFIFFNEFLNDI